MNIQRAAPINELLAKIIFFLIPSALIGYFLVWNVNEYFGVIGDPGSGLLAFLPKTTNISMVLSFFLLVGMICSAVFHAFRFRFLVPFIALVVGLYIINKGIDRIATGEFDAFFISVQFQSFSLVFIIGWLIGWGFMRLRYFAVIIAAILLCAGIFLIAKSKLDTVAGLLTSFSPVLLYAVYIIFTAEQIYSYKDKSQKFWWFLTRRLLFFGVLAGLLLTTVIYWMREDIKETVANYGGEGKQGQNSMLKKNKDGTFDLEQYTRLRGSLGRNNELLFCAHIDNFFEGTDIPNPLYLTAFHYTIFDTLTETFERDSLIPKNDLFEPNPSKIPLFFTETDSSVISNSMSTKLRKTVDVEVYSKALSPETYLAPSTGFFVQPIAIEKDFKKEFKTAFRAKSYVSEMNSAYLVYNTENPQLKSFQEERYAVLRKVTTYEGMDKKFMDYYTAMPANPKFQRIADLSNQIAGNAKTPIDKVLAIKDYFWSKDENGEPIFSYTDNPGVPDIPSASKLMYFLFENKKGYCAYYAGATLFMLRALGIPSRITVGFMTVDRSDKNKGWYWYYADQAHAWVQVFFPGYGWLDFDTTVGNEEGEQSPQPDGTPPMQPPRAWLAAEGIVTEIDTLKKLMKLRVKSMVFHDKEYQLKEAAEVNMDLKIAAIRIDSMEVSIHKIVKGDAATAVSYAEALKKMKVKPHDDGNSIVSRFPDPAPIDEVYLKRIDTSAPPKKAATEQEKTTWTIEEIFIMIAVITGVLLLLWLLLPIMILGYYIIRYKNAKTHQQPYWVYKTSGFYLHQLGVYRNELTPMQYAHRVVDAKFHTDYQQFMNIYLKQKYAQQTLKDKEYQFVAGFLPDFLKKIKKQIPFKIRFTAFLKPLRSLYFFNQTKNEES